MPKRDRAAYMRAYRDHRKRLTAIDAVTTPEEARVIDQYYAELLPRQAKDIAHMEEEIRHLKVELARQQTSEPTFVQFRPVPKPSQRK